MLNIHYGDTPEAVYNTAVFFKHAYEPSWITKPLSIQMIRDIDKSEVVSERVIQSPVLGQITPEQLSGGVKTLILMDNVRSRMFNASTCGNNCARWILLLAESYKEQRRALHVNLHHIMNFGDGPFKIRIVNTGKVVRNRQELVLASIGLV